MNTQYLGYGSLAKGLVLLLLTFLPLIEPSRPYQDSSRGPLLLPNPNSDVSRADFPDDFVFGTATASYQVEGGVKEGGRQESIWDYFTHNQPDKNNNSNGNVAVDFYHRYKEDIKLMKDLNTNSFRFSIAWSRVVPYGNIRLGVSIEGMIFYKDLIDELVANGIQPSVTLFHWDLPQELEDEYQGFLDQNIVEDFRDFARLCFRLYGDKVKFWSTFNEPWVFSVASYDRGIKAPGHCSEWRNNSCETGNSSTEPYIVAHNLLLAHSAVVEEFRRCDKCKGGKIGIVLCPLWFEPYSDSSSDKEAVVRSFDFMLGWHLNPLVFGDYPDNMKKIVGDRLPKFTKEQSDKLKNSYDYIGINYYGAKYAKADLNVDESKLSYTMDVHAQWLNDKDGVPLGPLMASQIPVYPEGLRYVLDYVKDNYKDPIIYITENGYDRVNYGYHVTLDEILIDTERVQYHKDHLQQLSYAIRNDGVKCKGYYVWSLLDNFEWNKGYSVRFGLFYIDYESNLTRHPKKSAEWYKEFLMIQPKIKQTEFKSLDFV